MGKPIDLLARPEPPLGMAAEQFIRADDTHIRSLDDAPVETLAVFDAMLYQGAQGLIGRMVRIPLTADEAINLIDVLRKALIERLPAVEPLSELDDTLMDLRAVVRLRRYGMNATAAIRSVMEELDATDAALQAAEERLQEVPCVPCAGE